VVFGRAKDGDRIGGLGIILVRNRIDLQVNPDAPRRTDEQKQGQEMAEDLTPERASSAQIGGGDSHGYERYVCGPFRFESDGSSALRASLHCLKCLSGSGTASSRPD